MTQKILSSLHSLHGWSNRHASAVAFCTVLLLLAMIGLTVLKPKSVHSLLIATGDWQAGDKPSIALICPHEIFILHLGGFSSSSTLCQVLKKHGYYSADHLIIPTSAPYPKTATAFLKNYSVSELVFLINSRSKNDWQVLARTFPSQGRSISCFPLIDHQSTVHFPYFDVCYSFNKDGTKQLVISSSSRPDFDITITEQKSGEWTFSSPNNTEFALSPSSTPKWALINWNLNQ